MLPADDRMDALTEAILSVRRRLEAIERRLARLEGEPAPVEPELVRPAPIEPAPPEPTISVETKSPPPPPAPS